MRTVTIKEAAELTGLSEKAVRRRIERGSLRSVTTDGQRRIPWTEVEPLMPDHEVRELRERVGELEREVSEHRRLVQSTERQAAAEAEARRIAEAAMLEARAAADQARDELHAIATVGWRERRRRLRALRAAA